MKATLQLHFVLNILLLSSLHLYSQDNYASNVGTTISNDQKLFIQYDIVVNDGSKFFKVNLDFTYQGEKVAVNPNKLYGDYGGAMTPGNKVIYWNYNDDFEGDISKVEVKVYAYRETEPKSLFKRDILQNNGYAPCEVIFMNQSTNADKYEWDFGDPASGVENVSSEENPVHTFNAGGSYTITLTSINSQLDLSDKFLETIIVKDHGETYADFQIVGNNREVPLTIKFQNISKNTDAYYWNFGDPRSGNKNNISREENPEHKYADDGKYVIELMAKNSVSGFSDKSSKEVILIRPERSEYQKHKTLKTAWIIGGSVSLGTGIFALTQSLKYFDEFKTATTDAEELQRKYKTYGTVSIVAFGLSAVCGVQVYIHAKKQAAAANQAALQLTPIQNGAMLSFTYTFK